MKDQFEYGDDSAIQVPTNAGTKIVTDLVDQALAAGKEADAAEAEATKKKEVHRNIIENLIPSAMQNLGLQEFTTTSGFNVTIKEEITHSLAEERRDSGMDWLENNGQGAVIKRELSVEFIKGQQELANSIFEKLRTEYPNLVASLSRNVHPQTLKALIKRLMSEGKSVPVDIFKVREFKKADIKMKATKKK